MRAWFLFCYAVGLPFLFLLGMWSREVGLRGAFEKLCFVQYAALVISGPGGVFCITQGELPESWWETTCDQDLYYYFPSSQTLSTSWVRFPASNVGSASREWGYYVVGR